MVDAAKKIEADAQANALSDENRGYLNAFLQGTKTSGTTGALGIRTEAGVADKRSIIINYCELHKWCDRHGRFSNQEARQIVEHWYPNFFSVDSE